MDIIHYDTIDVFFDEDLGTIWLFNIAMENPL